MPNRARSVAKRAGDLLFDITSHDATRLGLDQGPGEETPWQRGCDESMESRRNGQRAAVAALADHAMYYIFTLDCASKPRYGNLQLQTTRAPLSTTDMRFSPLRAETRESVRAQSEARGTISYYSEVNVRSVTKVESWKESKAPSQGVPRVKRDKRREFRG